MSLGEDSVTARSDIDLSLPMNFAHALPKGVARKAVDTLGRWIANDVLSPDSVIPTELELAKRLGVSRTTVRDAIKVLSGKGLVRTARRYGTRVLAVDDWNLLDHDVVAWHRRDHPRMRRIFAETTELRTILEPAAAALAAERATESQIRTIHDAAHGIHPEEGDVTSLFDADCRFHVTILDATGNRVMRQFRQILVTMLRVSYEVGVARPDNEPVSREGHIDVADAIRRHDSAGAQAAMVRMLLRNRRDSLALPAGEPVPTRPPAG